MKRKSLLAGILSLVLASSLLLSGCGGGTAAQAPAEETEAAVTSQETEAVEEEAPEAEAAEETAPEAEAAATETEAVEVTEQGQDNPLNFAMGQGFMLNTDIESPEIITAEEDFDAVEKALKDEGIALASSEVTMIPQNYVKVTDETMLKQINRILDILDDDDDVQNVYHNWDED